MKTLLYSALVSFVSCALFVQAVPAPQKRAASASDIMIFRFADIVEQLEIEFYNQAIEKFKDEDFAAGGFQGDNNALFRLINVQEVAHESFLRNMVIEAGLSPLSCKFNLDPVLKDVKSAIAFARTAEQAGTSTFSGAAHLISDSSLLTKVVTIVADDARHSTSLNLASSGLPFPAAYDVALSANEALSLVLPLFNGECDTGVNPNRGLAITNPDPIKAGTLVTFSSGAFNSSTPNLFCQIINGDSTEATTMPLNNCIIPSDVKGSAFIWATLDDTPLPNDVVARTKSPIVAGPALVFVDA